MIPLKIIYFNHMKFNMILLYTDDFNQIKYNYYSEGARFDFSQEAGCLPMIYLYIPLIAA
jgi:hypothetical protein